MTVTALPFDAVLLRCPAGHYEATTLEDVEPESSDGSTTWYCQRCPDRNRYRNKARRFALVKTVTIWPGGEPG